MHFSGELMDLRSRIRSICKYYRSGTTLSTKLQLILVSIIQLLRIPERYISRERTDLFFNREHADLIVLRVYSKLLRNSKVFFRQKCFLLQNAKDFDILTLPPDLSPFLKDSYHGTFLDIGAQIGKYSVLFADRFDKVIAVEAEKHNFGTLMQNIRLNKLEGKITALNKAVYNESDRTVTLTLDRLNLGAHSVLSPSTSRDAPFKQQDVRTITIDDLARRCQIRPEDISFAKIDVEGAEYLVLDGMREVLAVGRAKLVIEVQGAQRVKKVKSLLTEYGYTVTQIDDIDYLAERTISDF
jgi:FkbM family methyltransferase